MVKNEKILNKGDYIQVDNTTFRSKKACDYSKYTDDNGTPYWVNMRVDCDWGYIDNDGKVWKIKWV